CDLERRQADNTYNDLVTGVPERQAIEMFNEIALKVQTHYVDNPDWQRLAWRGTANLDVAITKQPFRQRYMSQVSDEQINAFRHRLRDDVNRRNVQSRNAARDLVVYTARIAAQDLGVDPSATIVEYCCGAIASLDPYSTYLTGGQLDDVYSQIEGNFVGLGIELKADQDELRVVKVIPGGPAEQAGMLAGDIIVAVDGQTTESTSTDAAADLLKGVEGSEVDVTLRSADQSVRSIRVTRRRVDVPCVEDARIIDSVNGTGYFRLTSFQKTTSRDVDEALWRLHRQGMRSLIIDIRGNPGGLLTASVEVADKFLAEGTIVSTRGRSARENFEYKAHRGGTWRVPLLVLIDSDSASASEIFAGAIRDHNRGTILGERSYGKGSVQGIFPLTSSRSGVRLTTAKFFSPHGQPISKVGVSPHRTIHQTARPTTHGVVPPADQLQDDPVISAAMEAARQLAVAHR
ncbi:MAG: S41 family peptidase, partial [Planctomycetota bacterium]